MLLSSLKKVRQMTRILIDADACPIWKLVEQIAKERQIPVILFPSDQRLGMHDMAMKTQLIKFFVELVYLIGDIKCLVMQDH